MVPITGPFSSFEYLNGGPTPGGFIPRIYERAATWYRQKKPYDLPLNYILSVRRVRSYSKIVHGANDFNYTETVSGTPSSYGAIPDLYNRVYNKFKEAVGESVQAGVALAEGRQAVEMIERRLMQMVKFTNAIRKGRLGVAAAALGIRVSDPRYRRIVSDYSKGTRRRVLAPGKGKTRDRLALEGKPRTLANLYLEFHFGWGPLMKDIFDAAEVLSSPILPHSIKVRSKKTYLFPVESFSDNGTDRTWINVDERVTQVIRMEGNIEVVNPNIALREQCGLGNPLTIINELIPFSFIADWFVNVGDFLSSFTDFAGVEITQPQRSIFTNWRKTRSDLTEFNYHSTSVYGPPLFSPFSRYTSTTSYSMEGYYHLRILGSFPGPILKVRDPWTLSARRGLAAASLLIQSLTLKGWGK